MKLAHAHGEDKEKNEKQGGGGGLENGTPKRPLLLKSIAHECPPIHRREDREQRTCQENPVRFREKRRGKAKPVSGGTACDIVKRVTPADLPVLFENNHFIAVDKPAGWLSIPGREGGAGAAPSVQAELSGKLGGKAWPIHRLDREVSGLILFAKDAQAHREANLWFERRQVHKFYEAWTEGKVPAGEGAGRAHDWRSTLLRGKRRTFESPHGKPAQTRARWQGTARWKGETVLRWRVEPLTGRPHQIRFELSRHGFPVLGDALYGAKAPFLPQAIALRAVRLDFSECPSAVDLGLPREIEARGLEPDVD